MIYRKRPHQLTLLAEDLQQWQQRKRLRWRILQKKSLNKNMLLMQREQLWRKMLLAEDLPQMQPLRIRKHTRAPWRTTQYMRHLSPESG